jgi:polysaccharide export outer membrane protein
MPSKLFTIGLVLLLAACGTLPRGAGLESEVLAGQNQVVKADGNIGTAGDDATELPAEFAVETVSRANLAKFASWPAVGEKPRAWIARVDQPNTRILAAGDTVDIVMWSTEDNGLLTGPGQRMINMPAQQISSGGQVFLPYIGAIKISGMSPEHAREAIQTAYTKVSPSVQVQLSAQEGRSNTASVLSGVGKPGAYPLLDRDFTILDLLAVAGGLSDKLVNPQLRLQRGSKTYAISAKRLMDDTSLNTTLVGGDRVFVDEDDRSFLSLGATGTKASHRFTKDQITALEALSQIGGLSDARANAKGILILRSYPASSVHRDGKGPRHVRTIFTLDLTSADGLFSAGQFLIRPGDVIYATESPLIGARNIFGVIGSVFGLANQASNL